jgi:protein TonB
MKLDIIKTSGWNVFEGRNKVYGAYELRKSNRSTTIKALIIGALFFQYSCGCPLILDLIPKGEDDNIDRDIKITAIKLPPKKEEVKSLFHHPPPPPKVDQVKFVKPVVAKAAEVTEEPPKIVEIKEKKLELKLSKVILMRYCVVLANGPK